MRHTPRPPYPAATPHTARGPGVWARYSTVLVGLWLFVSAFVLPHTFASHANTWMTGVLLSFSAAFALRIPLVRWATFALALWLILSTLLIIPPVAAEAFWSNLVVALGALVLSLVPSSIVGSSSAQPDSTSELR